MSVSDSNENSPIQESALDYMSSKPEEDKLSLVEEESREKLNEFKRAVVADPPDVSPKVHISEAFLDDSFLSGSKRMNYVSFKLRACDVAYYVNQWVGRQWCAPKGFISSARVPVRFARVFVPFLVTECTKKAIMTYTETTYGTGYFQGRVWHSVESKTKEASTLDISCIAKGTADQVFYSKFTFSSKPYWNVVTESSVGDDLLPARFVEDADSIQYSFILHAREEYQKKSLWQRMKCAFSTGEGNCPGITRISPNTFVLKKSIATDYLRQKTSEACQKELGDKISSEWSFLQDDPMNRRSNLSVQYLTHEDRISQTVVFLPFFSGTYESVSDGGNAEQFHVAVYAGDDWGYTHGDRPSATFTGFLRDITHMNG